MGLLAVPDEDVAGAMPAKLAGVGAHFRQKGDRIRESVPEGWVAAEFAVAETIAQVEAALAVPPADDPVLAAVKPGAGVDADRLRAALQEAVEQHVRPGLEAYRDALRDVALPQARSEERCGLSWLPGGDEAYDATLRYFTTTGRSAQEIHEIGLAQVAKLADEYRALGPEVVGTDDLQEIFEAMRTDPKLHFEHEDELVEQSRVALARAEAAMGDWFAVVPQAPCAVQGTQVGAKAFYFPPATDGSRGGTFFVNTVDPETWGRSSSSRRWPSTRACPATTSSSRSPPSCPTRCRSSASTSTTRRTPRAGASTPSGSPTRWASTPPRSTGWACTAPTRCAPAGSWSTPACTRSAGAGSRPSTTWWPTAP